MNRTALHWFRRDLRLADNVALATAVAESDITFCVFVFDTEILDPLPSRADRRVEFIWHSLAELEVELQRQGRSLIVLHGLARKEIPRLAKRLDVTAVFANRDYEPAAMDRDRVVGQTLSENGIAFHTCKDQVIFEKDELLSRSGRPFTVFAAYRNAWLKQLPQACLEPARIDERRGRLAAAGSTRSLTPGLPELQSLGFETTNLLQLGFKPGTSGACATFDEFLPRMHRYRQARDYPALRGVSYLSVHLRFGTISIRTLVGAALTQSSEGARTWLDELIWRDFYFSILYQFPHVVAHAFRRDLEHLPFTNREDHFAAWCEGRTGYPLVDAAMRQLNTSGYMHNRLRMLAASFLVKDLHVDWRWGERYFAGQLNDFDLAANNGGWQWAASTGNDAQPWFRIFNPVLQSQRFDPDGLFIRRYVTELAPVASEHIHEPWRMSESEQRTCGVLIGKDYPSPIVDHAIARKEALAMFGRVKPPKEGADP
jgi:deoxyribodipyrimidine photo-lyase